MALDVDKMCKNKGIYVLKSLTNTISGFKWLDIRQLFESLLKLKHYFRLNMTLLIFITDKITATFNLNVIRKLGLPNSKGPYQLSKALCH